MHNSNSGIFLSSAEKIYSEYVIPTKEIVTANILQYSKPMQCLLCCPISLFKSNNKNGVSTIHRK